MSRIYWDTMLFVYWLEDKEPYGERVAKIYARMLERSDTLCTSSLTLAELLVGFRKGKNAAGEKAIVDFFDSGAVLVLPFDIPEALHYGSIRASGTVKPADAIHLACAGSNSVDLFLTNDRELRRLKVPGIGFIDDLNTTLFD